MTEKKINHKLSPFRYKKILEKIELNEIILLEVSAKRYPTHVREGMNLQIKHEPQFVKRNEQEFDIIDSYIVTAKVSKKNIFKVKLVWLLHFTTKIEVNEDFYEIYAEQSLILNTYPYVREMIHSLTNKMDVPPLLLPLKKIK